MRSKKPQPTQLVTYLCTRCLQECTRRDTDTDPECAVCETGAHLTEVDREPLTAEAMEAAMMKSVDRMMTSLTKAYDAGNRSDDEEILLLEAMAKAKNLQKGIEKTFGKRTKKRGGVHHVRIDI